MVSRVAWQSLFLPQAAASFEHVLSMHLPQSVFANDGAGGGAGAAAAVVSAGGLEAAGASAAADDAAAAGASDAAGSAELAADELCSALCSAGLSAGLDSPPPQANQPSGTATMRTRAVMGRGWARLMDRLPSATPHRIKARSATAAPAETPTPRGEPGGADAPRAPASRVHDRADAPRLEAVCRPAGARATLRMHADRHDGAHPPGGPAGRVPRAGPGAAPDAASPTRARHPFAYQDFTRASSRTASSTRFNFGNAEKMPAGT